MARPLKEIDREDFEKLCSLQCTEAEICGWFDVTDKTLVRWCKRTYGKGFAEVYEEKRASGKISLRRMQWQLAAKNAAMAIFLGKNILGQTDRVEHVPSRDVPQDDKLSQSLRELAEVIDGERRHAGGQENTP